MSRRRLAIPLAALLACTASLAVPEIAVAGPGGLNLGWNDCGGLPASGTKSFACNTNSGSHLLFLSYVAPCCVTEATAIEIILDLQTNSPTLAPWWSMRSSSPMGCRSTALTQTVDFTGGPFTCFDYWSGGAAGGILMDALGSGNRTRIKAIAALPAGSPLIGPIAEGTEVYASRINISNTRTVGGTCPGCATEACLVLESIKITQPPTNPNGNKFISAPANRAFVTWQGWSGTDCYGATPARDVTWGSVKALYR